MPRGAKGEIDLGGCDGETLVFSRCGRRTACDDQAALPELRAHRGKQYLVGRPLGIFLTHVA
jgi:hypothetical protein